MTRSLKDVFEEAQEEIERWPDWKKELLRRARAVDAYFAALEHPEDVSCNPDSTDVTKHS